MPSGIDEKLEMAEGHNSEAPFSEVAEAAQLVADGHREVAAFVLTRLDS